MSESLPDLIVLIFAGVVVALLLAAAFVVLLAPVLLRRAEGTKAVRQRTVPVRIDDVTAASMKRVAAMRGVSVGRVASDAWYWWWNRYGDQVVTDLHAAVEAMRPR